MWASLPFASYNLEKYTRYVKFLSCWNAIGTDEKFESSLRWQQLTRKIKSARVVSTVWPQQWIEICSSKMFWNTIFHNACLPKVCALEVSFPSTHFVINLRTFRIVTSKVKVTSQNGRAFHSRGIKHWNLLIFRVDHFFVLLINF